MKQPEEILIEKAYKAFNARNINEVLLLMDADVHWPNGWEGGYVKGRNEVCNYWERQWMEIDPIVTPLATSCLADGRWKVIVHQLVKDKKGNTIAQGNVHHIYTFINGLITKMEIEEE